VLYSGDCQLERTSGCLRWSCDNFQDNAAAPGKLRVTVMTSRWWRYGDDVMVMTSRWWFHDRELLNPVWTTWLLLCYNHSRMRMRMWMQGSELHWIPVLPSKALPVWCMVELNCLQWVMVSQTTRENHRSTYLITFSNILCRCEPVRLNSIFLERASWIQRH
jgi:hypothetical protein